MRERPLLRRRGGNLPPGGETGRGMADGRPHRSAPTGAFRPLALVGLPPGRERRVLREEGGGDGWCSSSFIILLGKWINTIGSLRQVIQFSNHCICCCPLFSIISENGFLCCNITAAPMHRIQLSHQIQDILFVLLDYGSAKRHGVGIFVIPHDFFEQNTQLHIGVGRVIRRQTPVEDGLNIGLIEFLRLEFI